MSRYLPALICAVFCALVWGAVFWLCLGMFAGLIAGAAVFALSGWAFADTVRKGGR